MRLFRILHWRARAKYYQRKLERSERTVAMLRQELNAEMNRNREREDTFVSATVMGGRNMFGVAPRRGPVLQATPVPITETDQWQQLPWADKAEFTTEWWPLAQERGRSEIQARQDFMAELARRRQLNDEPFGAN